MIIGLTKDNKRAVFWVDVSVMGLIKQRGITQLSPQWDKALHLQDGTNKSLFNRLIKVLDSWQVEMLLTNSVQGALKKINQGIWNDVMIFKLLIFSFKRYIECRNWQDIGCVGHITRKQCASWFIGK